MVLQEAKSCPLKRGFVFRSSGIRQTCLSPATNERFVLEAITKRYLAALPVAALVAVVTLDGLMRFFGSKVGDPRMVAKPPAWPPRPLEPRPRVLNAGRGSYSSMKGLERQARLARWNAWQR